jgi:hypothetical protein
MRGDVKRLSASAGQGHARVLHWGYERRYAAQRTPAGPSSKVRASDVKALVFRLL